MIEGDQVELTIGGVAHGGHCVARLESPDGTRPMVVFVRHALPGEQVLAEITELHKGFSRADAVRILQSSPDRIAPRCPYAHPDGCGGCDLQHVAAPAQRDWKATVIREQLARLGGLTLTELDELAVRVAELPGGVEGWRTRVRYRVDAAGRAGLLKHRSHEVVPIERCVIAHPAIQAMDVLRRDWPDTDVIDVVVPADGHAQLVRTPPQRIVEQAVGRDFEISADGFWQVHPHAAQTLVDAVVELLDPSPGEHAWDLYGGAGLFAAALVRRSCSVTLVESAQHSARAAGRNLADSPVTVVGRTVERAVRSGALPKPDVVVLDPPRSGAGRQVVGAIIAAGPRAVAYVACDPAAFARDVRFFREAGWRLSGLLAFDCFPQTHHVECVGLLLAPDDSSRGPDAGPEEAEGPEVRG